MATLVKVKLMSFNVPYVRRYRGTWSGDMHEKSSGVGSAEE